jgi:TatD DNase family protein
LKVLRSVEFLPDKIMFHCFDLNEELAREIIKKGYSISVGGNITYKRTEQAIKVLKSIPLDKIMTETDSPYLAPTGQRGKRNSSKYIGLIVEKLSQIESVEKEKLSEILYNNAINFYNLK